MAERSWVVPGAATITIRGRIAGRSGPKTFCIVSGGRIVAATKVAADYEGSFECRLAVRGTSPRRLSLDLQTGNLLKMALGEIPSGANDLGFSTFVPEPDGKVQISGINAHFPALTTE